MLIYEKKVEENNEMVRHLFGTEGHIPSDEDVQLTYKDAEGKAVSGLTVDSKLLDDGHGGIKTEDGSKVNVWLGDVNIIPGDAVLPEPTVESIAVKTQPTKTEYHVGETADYTGIVIEATMSDESKETVDNKDCTFDPANGSTLSTDGEITVTVSALEKTTSFKITVAPAEPVQEGPGE